MLILTRRAGETVMIGDKVSVTIVAIQGNQVRIGVDAPRDIEVHREEIYQKIHEGKQERPAMTPDTAAASAGISRRRAEEAKKAGKDLARLTERTLVTTRPAPTVPPDRCHQRSNAEKRRGLSWPDSGCQGDLTQEVQVTSWECHPLVVPPGKQYLV